MSYLWHKASYFPSSFTTWIKSTPATPQPNGVVEGKETGQQREMQPTPHQSFHGSCRRTNSICQCYRRASEGDLQQHEWDPRRNPGIKIFCWLDTSLGKPSLANISPIPTRVRDHHYSDGRVVQGGWRYLGHICSYAHRESLHTCTERLTNCYQSEKWVMVAETKSISLFHRYLYIACVCVRIYVRFYHKHLVLWQLRSI